MGLGKPVQAVRDAFGDELLACRSMRNTAYDAASGAAAATPRCIQRASSLEQPFVEEDIAGHAALGGDDVDADLPRRVNRLRGGRGDAVQRGRVQHRERQGGPRRGYIEAVASTMWCAALAHRSGAAACSRPAVGRAVNLALAALPNFKLPGDTSASDRYYAETSRAFVLEDGLLRVPQGPGSGVEVRAISSRQ